LENPHTIRTLKTAPKRDAEAELRNAFLTALVFYAGDAVRDLWDRRNCPPEEHFAQAEAWCMDFRLTNGGKEIPKWLRDHAALALHLWSRGEGFADLLGCMGFDRLGFHTVAPDPAAGWQSEALEVARRRGRPRDAMLACQLVILHQMRRVPVATIAEALQSKHLATAGDALWIEGYPVYRDLEPTGLGAAIWPAAFMGEDAVRVAIADAKRALGLTSRYGRGRPPKEIRTRRIY
jgi:hypothetical protein